MATLVAFMLAAAQLLTMATTPSENFEEEMDRGDSMTVEDVVPMRISIWGDEDVPTARHR